jgi:hypothetical protein
VLEISFTVKDVARTRLAISPLWEVVASARVLKAARPDPLYRRWAETVRPRLTGAGPGVRLLFDLIQPCWYLPDFLSPPPLTPVPDLTAELTGLRDLPADQIRADLDVLAHALTHPVSSLEQVTRPRRRSAGPMRSAPSARVASLYDDPPDGLGLLASGIETYWRIAIEPWWGRIRATLDGDLVHRGRQLANGGHALLLDDLSPRVRCTTACCGSGTCASPATAGCTAKVCCWCRPLSPGNTSRRTRSRRGSRASSTRRAGWARSGSRSESTHRRRSAG